MVSIPGYRIYNLLYNGSRTLVYRGYRETDSLPVVIKLLKNPYPNFSELLSFRNQYTIAKNINSPLIVQTYSLEAYQNGYALVMEDFGGISLKDYFTSEQRPYIASGEEFLGIAIALCNALDILYRERILHKDIKPANILINPETKEVKLIDFSIASLLPRETQTLINPNVLEGTLAYISPEQTGRMNRGIDYRTDFYSLGVTFYELLTGDLPFTSNDAMELVHSHIAKLPPSLRKVKSEEIPQVLSDIVMKLMAKNAESRYQSALGLKFDLENCLHQLQETGIIKNFEIASRDVCDRFIIPDKLYGRETEVENLLQAFERVSLGATEMMLVAGFSGIGKTAVVNEVHKPIVRQCGYFIKGKYDQFQRNIPFSAFVQAFRDLMGQLLTESDAQIQQWKSRILSAVGDNGQVIIEVIPELEIIIGQQPPTIELSGTAAQNRFNLLFQKFTKVFTSAEHPLVMFLDDLQWADSASLKLMQLLMADTSHLLLIGAYRDNEVNPAHPLMLTLSEIQKTHLTINTITLAPLSQEKVNNLVADTLKCTESLAWTLSQLVYQKTQGNPFFATQFLKALHQENIIQFDFESSCWQCDMTQVKQEALTDDVVVFMAWQLRKLPQSTQNILQLAACIGNQFDLATLAIVSEQSAIETAADLWKALQSGLILPKGDVYKFYIGQEFLAPTPENQETVTYKFLHDRVQQAAYSLIPEEKKQLTHLSIGQLLLKKTPVCEQEERLFEIVNQLNFGTKLLTDEYERIELTWLNLRVIQKAKQSTAYGAAMNYVHTAMMLLPESNWETHYDLSLSLYESATEVSYLNGDYQQTEQFSSFILSNAHSIVEQVKTYEVKILTHVAQGQLLEAVQLGLKVVKLLGMSIPDSPSETDIQQKFADVSSLYVDRDILEFTKLPFSNELVHLAKIQILSTILSAAYISAPRTYIVIVLSSVELSITNSNTPLSAYTYAHLGILLCGVFQDISAGYKFGQLALKLLESSSTLSTKTKVLFVVAGFVQHWKAHTKETLPLLEEAYHVGLEIGDLEFAAYNAYLKSNYGLLLGENLRHWIEIAEVYSDGISAIRQTTPLGWHKIFYQLALNLVNDGELRYELLGSVYCEDEYLPIHQQSNDIAGLHYLHSAKLFLAYLGGNYHYALVATDEAARYLNGVTALFVVPFFYFYDSLIRLAICTVVNLTESTTFLEQVAANQEKLQNWADHAPMNCLHKFYLVEAEKCRVLGHKAEAIELYDKAISLAKANDYIQEEALANELAAKFYLDWGKEKVALVYMQEAYYCYARWGAKAKVVDLETRYPQLLQSILKQPKTSLNPLETLINITHSSIQVSSKSSSISDALDFASAIKAAQLLSSTIELDELLQQLTQIILHNSGGAKCILVLPDHETWHVRAISTPDTTELCSVPLDDHPDVPIKLIQYVKRTQSVVVIDNLQTNLPVIDDYLIQRQPKSVLCLPILNHGHLAGILYLKNQSTAGVFTSDRLTIINFLCTQAAISLENARLYQQSQQTLAELSLSQVRFQRLADNLPGIIYRISVTADGSSSTVYISSGCAAIYEVPPEDFIKGVRNIIEMEHPDDHLRMLESTMYSAQNLTPFREEFRIITPLGKVKWVQAASQPEPQADGSTIWDGVLLDITDQKEVELQLQASQQFLQLLINNIPQLVFWKDRNSTFLGCNISAAKTINLESPEQIVGKNDYDISIPEEAEWYQLCDRQVMESGEAEFHIIETQLQADGTQHWLDTNKIPLRDPDNNVIGILATIEDITDRKHAEATLQEKEQFLRSIYDGAEIAIFVLDVLSDSSFRYAGWNPASEKVTGVRSIDVAGKTLTEVMGEEQGERLRQRFAEIVTTGIDVSYEEHLCLQGQETWWFANLNPIKNLEGRVYRIIGTSFDISDRKKAELALQQKSLLLQQALTDLQNTQLQMVQSEKMSALGNLVAGVAHEMNNPLGFISASLEQAKPTFTDIIEHLKLYQEIFPNKSEEIIDRAEEIDLDYSLEDLPKMLDSMSMACDRLQNISTSLRTFSRADRDYKVPFNIHQGIDSTILILKHRLKANDQRPAIEFITNYGNLPQVECFPGQLNQVFMNLIANAIDALDESNYGRTFEGIKGNPNCITITTSVEMNLVKIAIADNGKGMNESVKSKIFDHLFTTKAVGKGTGLGLAIARQIVEETHGGKLSFNSVLGEGTEFIIEIPG